MVFLSNNIELFQDASVYFSRDHKAYLCDNERYDVPKAKSLDFAFEDCLDCVARFLEVDYLTLRGDGNNDKYYEGD